MSRVTNTSNFNESKISLGEEFCSVSKNDIGYGKIEIKYDNEQFLLRMPKCKTTGVQSTEMDNGYIRRTMPLVFEDPFTNEQKDFQNAFDRLTCKVHDQLTARGYPDCKLGKLDACFWRSLVFYPSIVESIYENRNKTRYFVKNEEVNRFIIGEGDEYEANAAILIDSVYVGEKTVSIQAKLYEVSLEPSKKRARVL